METQATDESYSLIVTGKGAAVQCTSYVGCAWGASTLLQLLCVSGVVSVQVAVPAVTVTDKPDVP
jgi:N-acetyl-beta-hexosaminidase